MTTTTSKTAVRGAEAEEAVQAAPEIEQEQINRELFHRAESLRTRLVSVEYELGRQERKRKDTESLWVLFIGVFVGACIAGIGPKS